MLKTAKITMAQGLEQTENKYGTPIEAKYELDDAGKLSLSVYPTGKGTGVDAERNAFQELAGDPTGHIWTPKLHVFTDAEHLTRSARELTLVQVSPISLREAVDLVQAKRSGIVYWAIPTIRDHKPGYGIYIWSNDGRSHYYFVS